MKWDRICKSVGHRVTLVPIACRLDEHGRVLPDRDDVWIIADSLNDSIRITNDDGYSVLLAKDHIHHFTSDPARSNNGLSHGILLLNIQLQLQGNSYKYLPCTRPGEPVLLATRVTEQGAALARLLDERVDKARAELRRKGTPQHYVDSLTDLTNTQKADLFERAFVAEKGRRPKFNPYR